MILTLLLMIIQYGTIHKDLKKPHLTPHAPAILFLLMVSLILNLHT
jgi:hypothetical protein